LPGTASANDGPPQPAQDHAAEVRAVLAAAVHELSQPLTVLNGTLELLQSGRSLPEQAAEAVDAALLQAGRAMRITHLLLEYSEEENSGVSAEPTSLRKLVDEMSQDLLALAEAFGHTIALEISAGAVAPVPGAPMRRAILRLVEQALEASPPGERVELALTGDVSQARIDIRDHGPAIPEEARRRWFDESNRIRAVPGRTRSLLKMALLKRDVRAAGGRLLAPTAEGGGACFTVKIPTH
jgi:signal transduction histidine kinase